jgi:hypothetical protein
VGFLWVAYVGRYVWWFSALSATLKLREESDREPISGIAKEV